MNKLTPLGLGAHSASPYISPTALNALNAPVSAGLRVSVHNLVRNRVDGEVLLVRSAEEQLHGQVGRNPRPSRPYGSGSLPRTRTHARRGPGHFRGLARPRALLVESGARFLRQGPAVEVRVKDDGAIFSLEITYLRV